MKYAFSAFLSGCAGAFNARNRFTPFLIAKVYAGIGLAGMGFALRTAGVFELRRSVELSGVCAVGLDFAFALTSELSKVIQSETDNAI